MIQGPAPVGIHFLPVEILEQIIKRAIDVEVTEWGGRNEEHLKLLGPLRRKLLQGFRLVNKSWKVISDGLFVPIIRIHLNEESLAAAEAISRTPELAIGVQGIQLVLELYPERLAKHDEALLEVITKKGGDLADCCRRALDSLNSQKPGHEQDLAQQNMDSEPYVDTSPDRTDYWNTQYGSQKRERATIGQVKERYSEALDRWHAFQGPSTHSAARNNSATRRWRELTQQVRQIFQRRQEEQVDLIQSGRFVETIGAMTRRLPNMKHAWAIDRRQEPWGREFSNPFTAAYTLLSDDELVKTLSAPLEWNWYFGDRDVMQDGEPQTVPIDAVSLLCEIPVAIDVAGAIRLRGWSVECWPVFGSVDLLHPENSVFPLTADDLAQAMSSLETFTFCPGGRDWPTDPGDEFYIKKINPENDIIMMDYLQLCISQPTLRSLAFHPRHLEMYRHDYESGDESTFLQRDLFLAVQSRQLRNLEISGMLMQSDVLRDLIRRLSISECVRFVAEDIELQDGSLYDIVEDLRAAFALFPNGARLILDGISGEYCDEADRGLTHEDSPIYQTLQRRVEIDEAIDLYIEGKVDVNPFDPTCLRDSYGPLLFNHES